MERRKGVCGRWMGASRWLDGRGWKMVGWKEGDGWIVGWKGLDGRSLMDDGWEGVGGWKEGDGWTVGWKVTDGYSGWLIEGHRAHVAWL